MKAVLLVSHGSRSSKTKDEVVSLVHRLKRESGLSIFEYAFLEIESPSIPDGIARCVGQGAKEITILLNFLNSGRHVNDDIPAIVQQAQKQFPQVDFRISKPVGQHPKIDELFISLIQHA